MDWKDKFIERFCDVHKPSNPWQPTAYKWTLFKTTETEDVFIFIESLLKKRDDALKTLAMLGLQSRCYEEYIDFRLAVDNALEIIDSPEGGSE